MAIYIVKYKTLIWAHINLQCVLHIIDCSVRSVDGSRTVTIWNANVNDIVDDGQRKFTTFWSSTVISNTSKCRLLLLYVRVLSNSRICSTQYAYHAMYVSFVFAVIFQVAWVPTSVKGPPKSLPLVSKFPNHWLKAECCTKFVDDECNCFRCNCY